MAALARTGAAIALNCSPMRLDVDEHTAKMAREPGVPVVLSAYAHSVRELEHLRFGIGIARRAWIGKEHVLNTRSEKELEDWRAARRSFCKRVAGDSGPASFWRNAFVDAEARGHPAQRPRSDAFLEIE